MNYFLFLCLFFMTLFCACSGGSNEPSKPLAVAEKELDVVAETELISRLSADLIPNANTEEEKMHNQMINYCIDNNVDAQKTTSGIYYEIYEKGRGGIVQSHSRVRVHYKGSFVDGRTFDTSYRRGKPLEFDMDEVIKGWQEVIPMLRPGGKGIFIIPPSMAYGPLGNAEMKIPPHTALVFLIELVEIV